MIPGIGPAHSLSFALDAGGNLFGPDSVAAEFEFRVTPPGHFAAGQLTDRDKIAKIYEEGQTR